MTHQNYVAQYRKNWLDKNRDYFNELKRTWYANNKEKQKTYNQRYEAKKKGVISWKLMTHPIALVQFVMETHHHITYGIQMNLFATQNHTNTGRQYKPASKDCI